MAEVEDIAQAWSLVQTGIGISVVDPFSELHRMFPGVEARPLSSKVLLTLDALVELVLDWHRPVKIFVETKHPVRYGSLVESKLLALLHRFGIASPASADRSRAVVMSFSAAAVWRIRRAAPLLPTVLLGRTARYLASSAATAVGATAVGPSLAALKDYPQLVDRAVAQGRAVYCWNVDEYDDIDFCRDVGVAWLATHHPGRTKAWLENARTNEGSS